MTEPIPDHPQTLIDAVNSLTEANARLGEIQQALIAAVTRDAALRTQKIQTIENTNAQIGKALYGLVAMFVVVMTLAIVNAFNLNEARATGRNAQQTQTLLVNCLTPGTECAKRSQAAQQAQLAQIRSTSLVIAICQRRFPLVEDPEGKGFILCVQDYYPDFALPPKGK